MPASRATLASLLVLVLVATGCGAAAPRAADLREARVEGEVAFAELRREYLLLPADAPGRDAILARLVAHLDAESPRVLEGDDYDAVVRHLARITALLAPTDFGRPGGVPSALAPLARYVAERGARRGDEARVMAATRILSLLEPGEPAHAEEYQRVATWGREARWGASSQGASNFFEIAPTLFGVWEEHARLTPAAEVLDALARLHVEFRDLVFGTALPRAFRPSERLSMPDVRIARALTDRLPLEVAAVHLAVGDLAEAERRVAALGDRHGIEGRLRATILAAARPDEEGADALVELGEGYERARPAVSRALARAGVRLHPTDARFPLALARLSIEADEPADATAWYAAAIERAPESRELYDEALGRLAERIEGGLFGTESSVATARAIGRDAARILAWRTERWPEEAPPVTQASLDLHLARAELAAGNVARARARLEASLSAARSREALVELGRLEALAGEPSRAVRLFQEALDRSSQQGAAASFERAGLLEQLGDAERAAGVPGAGAATYARALALLRPLADQGEDAQRALARVRIGVLSRRTGQAEAGATALRAALDLTPGWQEPYVLALSHLVVSEPAPELADELHHRAQIGLPLEPEWRVYLALWAQIVDGRAGRPTNDEAARVLAEQAERAGWSGRLAGFGAGTITAEALIEAASSPGERCEAAFYAGARRLVEGDRVAARALFSQAIETGMLGFFELSMARELGRDLR